MAATADTMITEKAWGTLDGKQVKLFTLKNSKQQEVDILNYGATIRAVRTPDKNKKVEDVVLGFDDIEGYVQNEKQYIGVTMGRVANRIRNGRYTLDGVEVNVSKNAGEFILHGGFKGWSFKIWESEIQNDALVLTLLSEDGDEGFPGAVIATSIFKLKEDGTLSVEWKAVTTKATPINLTNHAYFNLAGHGTNAAELYKHSVMINADRYTVTDATNIPTGEIKSVADSVLDLRQPTILGDVIDKVPLGGYDSNLCIVDGEKNKDKKLVAKVIHPESGRTLEIHSNQPGVQWYSSVNLPPTNTTGIAGKDGKFYFRHGAFCLETQNYPDAVNHPNFPNSILRPGQDYYHIVEYKFGVQA